MGPQQEPTTIPQYEGQPGIPPSTSPHLSPIGLFHCMESRQSWQLLISEERATPGPMTGFVLRVHRKQ